MNLKNDPSPTFATKTVSYFQILFDLEKSNSVEIADFNLWITKQKEFEKQIEQLIRARRCSPIGCRVCGRQDTDLVFNPFGSEWFCEGCYTFNQDYYKENPHPYEPNWRKIYP